MPWKPLPRGVLLRATRSARAPRGHALVRRPRARSGQIARIVETGGVPRPSKDPLCHARAGLTSRTKALFGPPGHGYVFPIYGMYRLLQRGWDGGGQGPRGTDSRVEPVSGPVEGHATNGPAAHTCAGITRADNEVDSLTGARARIWLTERTRRPSIAVTARGRGVCGRVGDAVAVPRRGQQTRLAAFAPVRSDAARATARRRARGRAPRSSRAPTSRSVPALRADGPRGGTSPAVSAISPRGRASRR